MFSQGRTWHREFRLRDPNGAVEGNHSRNMGRQREFRGNARLHCLQKEPWVLNQKSSVNDFGRGAIWQRYSRRVSTGMLRA